MKLLKDMRNELFAKAYLSEDANPLKKLNCKMKIEKSIMA